MHTAQRSGRRKQAQLEEWAPCRLRLAEVEGVKVSIRLVAAVTSAEFAEEGRVLCSANSAVQVVQAGLAGLCM